MTKIWLDDERPAPSGWIHSKDPEDALLLLNLLQVDEISLDHDLAYWNSEGREITGYDVLVTLERWAAGSKSNLVPANIHIHTANPAAYSKMRAAVDSINKIRKL